MMTVVHRPPRKPIRRTPLPDPFATPPAGVINGAAFTITRPGDPSDGLDPGDVPNPFDAPADTTGPVLNVPETTIRDLDDMARLEHILKAYKAARTDWATR
ncbi:hypothetical protein [Actinomyces culturomici]|uniref:hypothetical protein n=1 Tax=Actinomyces culturomici TaxID=1926276 RepID=UPI000E1FFC87|nr:hypothetical protein [Actinomyces culturomici]